MTIDQTPPTCEPPHFRFYGEYAGNEPCFYAPDDFPWVQMLRDNWTVIRQEFEDYFIEQGHPLKRPFVPAPMRVTGWSGVNLFTYGRRYTANCRHFPKTVAILESIPNLSSTFINLLDPHSRLPPHFGDSNTLYRAHLGLIIPGDVDSCGIQVDAERAGWKEGDVLIFNDARRHFVWNETDHARVILVCDVMKPQYGEASPWTCGRGFGAVVMTFLQTRLPLLRRLPLGVLRGLHGIASLPFQLYLLLFGMHRSRPVRAGSA